MNQIVAILTRNIFPIFLVAALGFLLQRRFELDVRTLNSIVFNVLSPCLVFSSLVSSELPIGELGSIALFTILVVATMGVLAYGATRLLRLSRAETAAFILVVMFVNGGNYGLTLNHLRYGEEGLSRAVVYYVVSTLLVYSVGIAIASMGHLTWRQTGARILRVPAFYAAVLAVIIYGLRIQLPEPLLAGISLAGSGAIPVMLLILGMQIAGLQPGQSNGMVWPAVGMRLLIGPLIAVLIAGVIGLQGMIRSTSIIEASMPTAVINIVLATEFGLPTGTVAAIVALATLFSPITLTAVISLLGL
ncbi:MAG: AEC family transporter [Chloroflexota bacterium]